MSHFSLLRPRPLPWLPEYFYHNRYVYLPDYVEVIGVPIVTFSIDTYWSRYYAGRSWYHRLGYWRGFWRTPGRYGYLRERREQFREQHENRFARGPTVHGTVNPGRHFAVGAGAERFAPGLNRHRGIGAGRFENRPGRASLGSLQHRGIVGRRFEGRPGHAFVGSLQHRGPVAGAVRGGFGAHPAPLAHVGAGRPAVAPHVGGGPAVHAGAAPHFAGAAPRGGAGGFRHP